MTRKEASRAAARKGAEVTNRIKWLKKMGFSHEEAKRRVKEAMEWERWAAEQPDPDEGLTVSQAANLVVALNRETDEAMRDEITRHFNAEGLIDEVFFKKAEELVKRIETETGRTYDQFLLEVANRTTEKWAYQNLSMPNFY